ncbi:LppP/LprE family lipoprotein [Pseudoclavibacter sp. AY1F1]|uniref:LppP/LprE family lipoprotein n=1 Tax=Pseudoclavibacter sp. AY1F1 TaxID=2080583 RepID=UPI0015E459B2|nr:LppP/LprE family lipoprotein [Pseudoclavibacter sp. AY1F1]
MRFSRPARTSTAVAAFALAALGLSGCSTPASPQAAGTPPAATVTVTATETTAPSAAQPSQSSAPETGTACADSTQTAALEEALPQVAAYPAFPDLAWVPAEPDRETWDSCAPLSYAVVTLEGGTASTPHHILLFHGGEYVGTATADAYGFFPEISQSSDILITVTYRYPLEGEPNAAPTGEAVATYAWDEATQSVVMDGDLPPV